MAKKEETIKLEKAIYRTTKGQGIFGCLEVTIGWWGKERVDYITYDTNDIWKCYEIKVTKQDFYSKCHNTFVGNYNYYVMPKELYEQVKQDIPDHVGVYCENNTDRYCRVPLRSVKKALKQELKADKEILKNSFIRSLYRTASEKMRERED